MVSYMSSAFLHQASYLAERLVPYVTKSTDFFYRTILQNESIFVFIKLTETCADACFN